MAFYKPPENLIEVTDFITAVHVCVVLDAPAIPW
jgi:hypothetical protein